MLRSVTAVMLQQAAESFVNNNAAIPERQRREGFLNELVASGVSILPENPLRLDLAKRLRHERPFQATNGFPSGVPLLHGHGLAVGANISHRMKTSSSAIA